MVSKEQILNFIFYTLKYLKPLLFYLENKLINLSHYLLKYQGTLVAL
jgi:hypothetical protein